MDQYGIQWISSVNHHDLKTSAAGQLIIDPRSEEDLMASANSSCGPPTEDDEGDGSIEASATTTNIDQIAAENLIFMARDAQMLSATTSTTNGTNGTVVVTTSDGEQIDCDAIMEQAALIQQHEDTGGGGGGDGDGDEVYRMHDYTDTTPQMVTEEVITDDWVQHQGEER